MKFRQEFDSIGQIKVPVDKYWGASTQRSKKYFDIGEFLVRPILIKSIAIMSNDPKRYEEDSFDNMVKFSKNHNFNFPYVIDETQQVAKTYGAVCTPDFFGYNKDLELQYRGRIRELQNLKPTENGDSELKKAMKMIAKSNKGPNEQFPSMGCSIKWF